MPKVIAVFADGTGNSAAKLFKTNVWRLYDALDTSDPGDSDNDRQIAYYHDGVGTSSFKPLAIVGGAFGWGLKRNVLDLYTFICRNYEANDQICAFGFSRGAFTVRLLAGLVAEQGLVENTSESDLKTYARDAYRQFRRKFKQTGGLVELLRNIRDGLLTLSRRITRKPTYAEQRAAHSVCYIGDDVGDLPAFDAVEAMRDNGIPGLTVASGSSEVTEVALRADLVVEGPPGVLMWLESLADAFTRKVTDVR